MSKKICTITISLPGKRESLTVPFPQSLFYFLSFATLIGIFTLTIFVVNFTRMVVKVREFNELRREVNLLKTVNQQYEVMANQMTEKLSLLETLAKKVSATIGFETKKEKAKPSGKEKAEPAQQSFFLDFDQDRTRMTQADYVEMLNQGTRDLEERLNNLEQHYSLLNFRLAHSPTLWPTQGAISDRFGGRESSFHSGIDISTPQGTPVVSAAEGVVHLAGWRSDYGNMVILDHGYGLTTWYAHLTNIFVDSGQLIKKGQLIGTVGSTGRATGPHLHYEIRQADRPLNPMIFILGPGQTQ